jgi:hypothetical protein
MVGWLTSTLATVFPRKNAALFCHGTNDIIGQGVSLCCEFSLN